MRFREDVKIEFCYSRKIIQRSGEPSRVLNLMRFTEYMFFPSALSKKRFYYRYVLLFETRECGHEGGTEGMPSRLGTLEVRIPFDIFLDNFKIERYFDYLCIVYEYNYLC